MNSATSFLFRSPSPTSQAASSVPPWSVESHATERWTISCFSSFAPPSTTARVFSWGPELSHGRADDHGARQVRYTGTEEVADVSPQLQKIEQEALLLPPEDREFLVERLLRSLQDRAEADIDPTWIAEAERRYHEYRSGQVQAIPGDGLFDQTGRKDWAEASPDRRLT